MPRRVLEKEVEKGIDVLCRNDFGLVKAGEVDEATVSFAIEGSTEISTFSKRSSGKAPEDDVGILGAADADE